MGVRISQRSVDALTTVVELEGDLDLYSAAEVNASLVRAVEVQQFLRLVVDLRAVTSLDFSTIALLIKTARALEARHGSMEVRCEPGEIGRLLTKAGEGRFAVRVEEP